jgi:alpha-L-fucosidase
MSLYKYFSIVCLAGFFSMTYCPAQPAESQSTDPVIQQIPPNDPRWNWWRDARFGMFIHWGPISQKGEEISWSRGGVRPDRDGTGSIPADVYDNLYKSFDPEKFDAKQWVEIAQAAGMKYIVLVAKHHDGFCMFDSKLTDYKITNSPFHRDICAELATACHEAGMPFGVYYSPPDWHNPDFIKNQDKYIDYIHGQVRELLTNYGQIDELWFDSDGGVNKPETWDNATLFPMIRKLQPQVLITKRCGGWGDFNTPEQRVGGFDNANPWETCMTICNQWAWKPNDQMKSLKDCLQNLILSVGGDGNFLFNVGPMPTGEIEPRQVDRLKEMGTWLATNGESIYGTRGGPFLPSNWGASTRKGNAIYLHILNWTGDKLTLPSLDAKITQSTLLTGGKVTVDSTDDALTLHVDPSDRKDIDTIVKLTLTDSAMDMPLINSAPGYFAIASTVYQNDPTWKADRVLDEDPSTRWATDEGVTKAWLEIGFGKPRTIDSVTFQEAVKPRIKRFSLQYWDAGEWKTIFTANGSGDLSPYHQTFPTVKAKTVRLNILDASNGPSISEVSFGDANTNP